MSSRRRLFLAAVFGVFSILFVTASFIVTGGDGTIPPPQGDTQDYDNLAIQIMRGKGFGIDYTDPEWKRPYEAHNQNGDFNALLSHKEGWTPNTFRPPLLPYALAITYRIFGRDFLTWRLIQSFLTAFALALVCDVAWTAFGAGVAILTSVLLLASPSYVTFVAYQGLLTEPLAILTLAAMVWALSRMHSSPGYKLVALCGVYFALLCFSRSFYVVWLPGIAVLVWWLRSRSLKAAAVFIAVAMLVQLPWWVRNIRVTGHFMPFGTQAGVAMHTAYSDLAMAHRGNWWIATRSQAESAHARETGRVCKGCDDTQLALYGIEGARIWAMNHPRDVPRLALWKVENTLMFADSIGPMAPVLWLVLVAPLVAWRRRAFAHSAMAVVALALAAMTLSVVALTWAMQWRFMVPIEPFLLMMAALPLAGVIFGERSISAGRRIASL